jgi:Spy/CpxP family protein refolding chaperone
MKSRARALAVMIALLLAGCLLGIAGHHFWEMRFRERAAAPVAPQVQRQTDRLAKRLQLNAEQAAQLKAILDESRLRINAGRAEYDSKLEAIRAQTNEKIAAILNDEQRKRFQQLLSEADAHRRPADRGDGRGGHEQKH